MSGNYNELEDNLERINKKIDKIEQTLRSYSTNFINIKTNFASLNKKVNNKNLKTMLLAEALPRFVTSVATATIPIVVKHMLENWGKKKHDYPDNINDTLKTGGIE